MRSPSTPTAKAATRARPCGLIHRAWTALEYTLNTNARLGNRSTCSTRRRLAEGVEAEQACVGR